MENWLFIVDLPIKHGDFPSFFVGLPEGTYLTSENSRSSSPTLVTGAPRHLFSLGKPPCYGLNPEMLIIHDNSIFGIPEMDGNGRCVPMGHNYKLN